MSIATIRQVKRELRVLGIAARPSIDGGTLHVVGAVFRGSLWLDGILAARARGSDLTERVVEMIRKSPHHPQIRVLMLQEPLFDDESPIDPYRLSAEVSRPAIVLARRRARSRLPEAPEGFFAQSSLLRREGVDFEVLSIGLKSRDAERVLDVATGDDVLPEALRVAEIIASALSICPKQNV